jgi:hypothetical protein
MLDCCLEKMPAKAQAFNFKYMEALAVTNCSARLANIAKKNPQRPVAAGLHDGIMEVQAVTDCCARLKQCKRGLNKRNSSGDNAGSAAGAHLQVANVRGFLGKLLHVDNRIETLKH